MTVPNMPPEEFKSQAPDALFLFLTSYLYDARKRGALDDAAAVLAVFDADARRALAVGTAALMAMAPGEYRDALRAAMAKELFTELKEGNA